MPYRLLANMPHTMLATNCVYASMQLSYHPRESPDRWAGCVASAAASLASAYQLQLPAHEREREMLFRAVAAIVHAEPDSVPMGVGCSGYSSVSDAQNAMNAFALHAVSMASIDPSESPEATMRWSMPLPAISGSRWVTMRISMLPALRGKALEDTRLHFDLAMSVFKAALSASYQRAILEPEIRERALYDRLSVPQRNVARGLVQGQSESVIAKNLNRSKHTVHDHIRTIYQSFGVKSRYEFLMLWRDLLDAR